jgi:hypothetical protein
MKGNRARSAPSWRVSDARPLRPQVVLIALAVMGILLTEVWQCSTVASLSDQVGRATHRLQQANAELEWTRSQLERASSRATLGPVAGAMGLKPTDPQAIVLLPEEYLEPAETRAGASPNGWLALAGRAAGALVPEASAHGRRVN